MQNSCVSIEKVYDRILMENLIGYFRLANMPLLESNGRFVVEHKDVEFDCFFYHKTDSRKLYVFFSGGRDDRLVKFHRWSWYTFIDGSMLNIDDPMYKQFDKVRAAYYYGTLDCNYRELVCDIVRKFIDDYSYEEVIFWGDSSGGSAAIHCGCLIEGSQIIAINSQIKLSLDVNVKQFETTTGMHFSEDVFSRNEVLNNVCKSKSTFIFAENMASKRDEVQRHYLMDFFGISNNECGIVRLAENSLLWNYNISMEDVRLNHQTVDNRAMFWAFSRLSSLLSKDKIDKTICEDYKVIAGLWKDTALLMDKLGRYSKAVDESGTIYTLEVFCRSAKNVYIFGAGKWGEALFNYCENHGIDITGFVVTNNYLNLTREKTNRFVQGLTDLESGSKLLIATSRVEAIKAVIESGLQYHILPEWFLRDISGS